MLEHLPFLVAMLSSPMTFGSGFTAINVSLNCRSPCNHLPSSCQIHLQAALRLGGHASSRRVAPLLRDLYTDWGAVAMRVAFATRNDDRELKLALRPSDLLCLSKILQAPQTLKSIAILGGLLVASCGHLNASLD